MPIPLALALLPSIIGTGVGLAQQSKLRKDLESKRNQAEQEFDRSLQAVRDISFEPSQELRDARMSQLEAGRAIGDLGRQRVDEASARAIATLRDSPRALQSAGLRGVESALSAAEQADIAGTQQTLGAEMGMAQDAEAARQAGIQRDMALEQLLMGRAAQAGDVAQTGIYGTQAAQTEAIMGLGNLGTQGMLQFGDIGMPNTTNDFTPKTFEIPQAPRTFTGETGSYRLNEKGGYIGENGGMTEGEFDHDTNKKAVIDEESGEKEGELTGGEMVFNPEQTDGITGLVEKGDAEGLLMFMKDLLSQPQFQEA